MAKWLAAVAILVGVAVIFASGTVAQEEKKTLDEGEWLSLDGQFVKAGSRPAFKVTEGEHSGKTFVILENSKLEEVERLIKGKKVSSVQISCDVTKYNNANYIVISSFIEPYCEDDEGEDRDK
jgi:hypothetical protein